MDADSEGKLLAGDRVDEHFEGAGKAWGPGADEAPGEDGEALVRGCQLVEAGEVGVKPEHPFDGTADPGDTSLARGLPATAHLDAKTRALGVASYRWCRPMRRSCCAAGVAAPRR